MENYTFSGLVGNDASSVKTKKGFAINFDVAINKSYYTQKTKEYVNLVKWAHCTKWAKSDHVATLIKKGMFVVIEGEATSKHYVDVNGEIIDTFNVNVFKVEFFDKKENMLELTEADLEPED